MRKTKVLNKETNIGKYYIIKNPTRISDLREYDLYDDYPNGNWREKARRLQARRWRKIKHQLA